MQDVASWKIISLFYFNKFGPSFILFNITPDTINAIPNLKDTLPGFYFDIVKTWFENNIQTETSLNYRTVRQEILWGNKIIKFENNCLIYPAWIKDGIIFINNYRP